jgi:hypothetical protein
MGGGISVARKDHSVGTLHKLQDCSYSTQESSSTRDAIVHSLKFKTMKANNIYSTGKKSSDLPKFSLSTGFTDEVLTKFSIYERNCEMAGMSPDETTNYMMKRLENYLSHDLLDVDDESLLPAVEASPWISRKNLNVR